MVQIVYFLLFMPFEESLVGRLELFNEYTAMILLYHAFMFTALIPSLFMQRMAGFSFIAYMCLNMLVHFYFLLKSTYGDMKKSCKKRYKKWKNKQKNKKGMMNEEEISDDERKV